jgi:methoxymalonate biosynthesis protein
MEARQGRVKCVVWDLDRTLLPGVLLERDPDGPVELVAGVGEVLATLHGRGILNSIASRNPPALAAPVVAALPVPVVAPQFGWGNKSESLARIADELNIDTGSLAFVDDDPYERSEVSFALPQVIVLAPDDAAGALDWPEFSPAAVTEEGARRAETYLNARRRTEALRSFGRDREAFHRYCETTVSSWAAGVDDVPRLHELSVRTSQFNSAGAGMAEADLLARIDSPRHRVVCLRLADRFGDDGLVGSAVVARGAAEWTVELLMMSCRAMGRGVIETLLAELAAAAADAGAAELRIPLRVSDRNVPLRLAMVSAGFRADNGAVPIFVRSLTGPQPAPPEWINIVRQS